MHQVHVKIKIFPIMLQLLWLWPSEREIYTMTPDIGLEIGSNWPILEEKLEKITRHMFIVKRKFTFIILTKWLCDRDLIEVYTI